MSWYTDPELFINCWDSSEYYIDRIVKKYNVPLSRQDIINGEETELDFYEHLSLGYNEESDYDAFKSWLAENVKFVNCQGLVIHYDEEKGVCTWSRLKVYDSIFYSLPGIKNPLDTVLAEKQAVEEKTSELVEEISSLVNKLNNEVTNLQEQLNQEKKDRQAQVSDLTAKLEECCRAGCGSFSVEPWMSDSPVLAAWVPFEELDVLNIPRDTPLTITQVPAGAPKFVQDTTTNVQADHFCQGIFPVVVVNVADLIPNNGKARFDPDIWCSINSAGNSYAARKLSESEMSVSPHKTG